MHIYMNYTLGISFILLSASVFGNGLSQYNVFISDPPWIGNMVFAQSGNLLPSRIGDAEPHDTPGFVYFKTAVQSNSWYIEIVTNAPMGKDDYAMGDGFVVGKSFSNYWAVYSNKKNIVLCPFASSHDSPLNGLSSIWLRRVQMIQKLGLIYLEPGKNPDIPQTINWVDELHFQAITDTHGTMNGKIVEFTNGLPKRVEYTFSKVPRTTFSIVYGYVAGRAFPPTSITAHKITGNNSIPLWEFRILDIELVDSGRTFNGYSPNDFMSSNQIASANIFIENGERVTYVSSNGITTHPDREAQDYSFLQISSTLPQKEYDIIKYIIWIFVAASGVVLFWLIRKQT